MHYLDQGNRKYAADLGYGTSMSCRLLIYKRKVKFLSNKSKTNDNAIHHSKYNWRGRGIAASPTKQNVRSYCVIDGLIFESEAEERCEFHPFLESKNIENMADFEQSRSEQDHTLVAAVSVNLADHDWNVLRVERSCHATPTH